MTLAAFAYVAVRAAVIFAVALVAMRILSRASAAARRSVLVTAFVVVLGLPIASALLPALHLRDDAVIDRAALVETSVPDSIVRAVPLLSPVASSATAAPATVEGPRGDAGGWSLFEMLGVVWAIGAIGVLARLGVGIVRARRLVTSARFVETLDIGGRPVEIRISSAVETPAVTGLFVPVVLLPVDAETWTAERRRVVLAHELAHVKSHDCLAGAIAQVAVALHWFDPLAWIAAWRLRAERELAADERVLDQGVLASTYAEHLLALATADDRLVPAGALAMAESAHLSARIHAVLAPRAPRFGRSRFAVIAAALASVAVVVACATPERDVVTTDSEPVSPVATPTAPAPAGSTIDPQIQAIAEDELERMNREWAPCFGIVVVLDPATGHVLAVAYRGGGESDPQHAAARPMVAGSTVKPIVVAAALEEGVLAATDRFDTSAQLVGDIVDYTPHGVLDVGEILAVSSNVGLAKIFERLGGDKLATWHRRFHLAAAPAKVSAEVAIGARLSSTPLEVAAAFATLANDGVYHPPTFVAGRSAGERVVRAETAKSVLALLEGVTGDRGTGKAARVAGARVAGKTATAHLGQGVGDLYASFVGAAPLERPRYVIFVGAETPRDGKSGGQVAAPVFGRVMSRLLAR